VLHFCKDSHFPDKLDLFEVFLFHIISRLCVENGASLVRKVFFHTVYTTVTDQCHPILERRKHQDDERKGGPADKTIFADSASDDTAPWEEIQLCDNGRSFLCPFTKITIQKASTR